MLRVVEPGEHAGRLVGPAGGRPGEPAAEEGAVLLEEDAQVAGAALSGQAGTAILGRPIRATDLGKRVRPATGLASGFADCDGKGKNGCEASLDAVTSCGACGTMWRVTLEQAPSR